MPENEETKETQETQQTPETQATLEVQLEEEKKAKAAVEASLAEKDARIAELEASFTWVKDELSQVKEAHSQAVSKYLDAVRLANPTIPQDIIAGQTIEGIDASLAKATTIAESVKANLEAQSKEARVPAGAPPRTEISLEGLSPREKIAAGIQQKGGSQS